jgi:hypothetical protein
VRDIDFGRVWLRINVEDESEKEDIIAEYKCDTKTFLERCLVGAAPLLSICPPI